MRIVLVFFLFLFPLSLISQNDIHNLEFEDGLKVTIQIENADGENTPDLFIGARLLATAYVMKNLPSAMVRASAAFNYIEGMNSLGIDGFAFPFRWHTIKSNSSLINLATTPGGAGYYYNSYSIHLCRLNDIRVVRLAGFHGGYRHKLYPNGDVDIQGGGNTFFLHELKVHEFSLGLGISSRRGIRLKIMESNAKELGAKKNWTGTISHWFIWTIYTDVVLEQAGKFRPSLYPTSAAISPQWQNVYSPFPLVGWRVVADSWWSRQAHSRNGNDLLGFSTHFAVQKSCFSWLSGNGYSFYALLGITYARQSTKAKTSSYSEYKIAPGISRKGGSQLIIL